MWSYGKMGYSTGMNLSTFYLLMLIYSNLNSIILTQVSYADVLKKVEPLRDELKSLENQASDNKVKNEETTALIAQLEQTITEYQEEYAQLISQAQAIKSDLENVQSKV